MAKKSITANEKAGAREFQDLMERITAISNATACRFAKNDRDHSDYRDYCAIVAEIEASLESNLDRDVVGFSGARREGFLRALGYFLTLAADGCVAGEGVDPIAETAQAYGRRGSAESRWPASQ